MAGNIMEVSDFYVAMAGLPVAQAAFGAIVAVEYVRRTGQVAKAHIGAAVRAAVCSEHLGKESISNQDELPSADGLPGPIDQLEDVLAIMTPLLGQDKPGVQAAKQFLREKGAKKLASRLGKLSSFRNRAAHPDMSLKADIRECIESCDAAGSDDAKSNEKEAKDQNEGDADRIQQVFVASCCEAIAVEVDHCEPAVVVSNMFEAIAVEKDDGWQPHVVQHGDGDTAPAPQPLQHNADDNLDKDGKSQFAVAVSHRYDDIAADGSASNGPQSQTDIEAIAPSKKSKGRGQNILTKNVSFSNVNGKLQGSPKKPAVQVCHCGTRREKLTRNSWFSTCQSCHSWFQDG